MQLNLKIISQSFKGKKLPTSHRSIYCCLGRGNPKAAAKVQNGDCNKTHNSVQNKAQLVPASVHSEGRWQKRTENLMGCCQGVYDLKFFALTVILFGPPHSWGARKVWIILV